MSRNKVKENLILASFDDIFTTGSVNNEHEGIIQIPLCELYPPEFHPFQVNDDDAMVRLTESVRQYGVIKPGLVRSRKDTGYELLCGNRRKRACELAGFDKMPVMLKEFNDDIAAIIMVEDNLQQREKILPSERALAYRVMMEALNHNGIKGDNHSYEIMVERTGVKKSQLFRIIRLTELIASLSDKVDTGQLAFNPAVELSYLSVMEQTEVAEAMKRHETKPSLSQAIRLKKMKQDGKLTIDIIDHVLSEEKKPEKTEQTHNIKYHKYFPSDYSQKQIDTVIIKLLKNWKAQQSA